MQNLTCAVDECALTATTRGWCNTHYLRWYRRGDPLAEITPKHKAPELAFAANTTRAGNGCLVWTAGRSSAGYGNIYVDGKTVPAHRYAWAQANGTIPDGMHIDHICHNPPCCNPEHLRLATPKQNTENMKGPRIDNLSTGIRGVRKRGEGKFEARAAHHGKYFSAGIFRSIEDAEVAAIALRNRLFTHNNLDRT